MAITDIIEESEVIDAGAPSIKYEGERPLQKENIKTAGPDWYIKRLEHLMFLGYEYDEAGEIASDNEKYFEAIGSDESRNTDQEEIVEEEGIMRAAHGGAARRRYFSGAYGQGAGDRGGDPRASKSQNVTGRQADNRRDAAAEARERARANQATSQSAQDIQRSREMKELIAKQQAEKDYDVTGTKKIPEGPTTTGGGDGWNIPSPWKRSTHYNLATAIPGSKGRITNMRKAYAEYLKSMGITPSEELEDTENLFNYFDKQAFDKTQPGPINIGDKSKLGYVQNYGDFIAEKFGAPGVKHSGNVGHLEKFVKTYEKNPDGSFKLSARGNKIPASYGYKDKTGDDGGVGGSQSEWQRLGYPSPAAYQAAMSGGMGAGSGSSGSGSDEEEDFELALAFRADGGRVPAAFGGMMGNDGRRAYGLGSIFKKAKKIFKSPLGQAALLGLGGWKSSLFSGKGGFLKNIGGWFGKEGALSKMGLGKVAGGIGLASLGAGMLAKGYQDEDEDGYDDNTGFSVEEIRNSPYKYLAPANKAYGGRIGAEEGGLMDMGGMEKDYRADGGFVPIGGKERADDVPARLSKNEFVFTADAVRNAGGGDIDKGSEVMYNVMKNLEAGGDVSQDSQGLDGAREMFQTSQRLEEVL